MKQSVRVSKKVEVKLLTSSKMLVRPLVLKFAKYVNIHEFAFLTDQKCDMSHSFPNIEVS